MRLTCLALWTAALAGFVLSSNTEANVCRPLYDEPTYETVTKIMDCPAITGDRGLFSWLVFGNGTPVGPFDQVVESCKANRTAYKILHLDKVFDAESSSDYSKWPGLAAALDGLRAKRIRVDFDPDIRPPQQLSSAVEAPKPISEPQTNYDFQKFRSLISASSLEHGRVTFLRDQLNALSAQTTTFSSTILKSTLKRLVANMTDLVETVMGPLSKKKNTLLYHLTLMEIEMQPLSEFLNQTWTNAYTARIENSDFDQILQKNIVKYTNGITSLLDKYKSHVTETIRTEAASCRPIWNMYRIGRDLICRQALDAFNGFWFMCFVIAVSITLAIPVVKNLKIFHRSTLNSMSLYTIPPPPAMELMITNS